MLLLLSLPALAGEPAADAPSGAEPWASSIAPPVEPRPDPPKPLRFVALFDTKAVVSDIGSSNALVNGQIVGTLGGANASVVQAEAGGAVEQRLGAFFTYTPRLFSGRAALSAAFEVDYAWGDVSYSIGGNTGGGVGADQVNLQTRRMNGRFTLVDGLDAVVGLQFVGDGAADPDAARLDDLVRSGGRLLFFGTEAAGVSLYGRSERLEARLGGYTLYELGLAAPDDVTLWMGDARWAPAYAVRLGAHAWYLRDRAGGAGGILGTGITSALSEWQGGPRLDLREGDMTTAPEVSAALGWFGVDAGYNHALDRGDVGATALAMLNVGRLYVVDLEDRDVLGGLVDVEARWRWTQGAGSVVRAELLYTTGDAEGGAYTGVVTGNSYGIAAAQNASAGTLLLFPDLNSVNRQVALVYDASNAGRGLVGATATVGYDPVPDVLTVAVGGGHARTAGGAPLGSELNGRVTWRVMPLLNLGLAGGALLGTEFERVPYVAYTSLNWVVP